MVFWLKLLLNTKKWMKTATLWFACVIILYIFEVHSDSGLKSLTAPRAIVWLRLVSPYTVMVVNTWGVAIKLAVWHLLPGCWMMLMLIRVAQRAQSTSIINMEDKHWRQELGALQWAQRQCPGAKNKLYEVFRRGLMAQAASKSVCLSKL